MVNLQNYRLAVFILSNYLFYKENTLTNCKKIQQDLLKNSLIFFMSYKCKIPGRIAVNIHDLPDLKKSSITIVRPSVIA